MRFAIKWFHARKGIAHICGYIAKLNKPRQSFCGKYSMYWKPACKTDRKCKTCKRLKEYGYALQQYNNHNR